MMDDWAKFTRETRAANGLAPVPSFRESVLHFWCMLAHGAYQTSETFQPRMVKITCDKCRIYWIEPRV